MQNINNRSQHKQIQDTSSELILRENEKQKTAELK